ncbi:SPOR domain-containing protein [Neisseria meningitidis]|uniref:SPOR domain-containing protein n=1 Tax=Neisseria meningitidis TaxID=487 RepID=UPI00027CA5FA|nr:SPOR domain-containing protein [Neisseria meningitidis]EJU50427.1 MCM family protein [Neisseria meningitidis 93004]MBW3891987.1 SPOR domain-containing protein [Neisseria meningitidis]CWP40136.1 Sporulation related domain protein [Neisseria meningitidis]CWT63118.1 Sporulation related domain protein [Neisseria meningitidis]
MKWLFILLVAINIAVFGGTVGYKLTLKQAGRIPEAQNAANNLQVQPVAPTMPVVRNIPASGPVVQAASESDTGALLKQGDILSEEQAEQLRLKKEAEQKKLKEKKQREEKARREKLAAEKAQAERENGAADALCAAQASLTMDEDDYHRIKGLLGKWSHVASRSVEKRTAKAKPADKTYRVVLPVSADAENQAAELSAKGFNPIPFDGALSLGVGNSRENAQALQNRLAGAGFGGAHIVEHFAEADRQDDSLSVSRMTVLFTGVNAADADEIRKITSLYGKLNLKSCK